MRYNIYPIPYEVRGLEYLNLLHKHIQNDTLPHATFHIEKFSWLRLFFASKKNNKHTVHIHWETNIYGSKYAFVSLVRMVYRFLGLFLLKLRGIKVIWTMHNLEAHDYPHPWIDRIGKSIMWKLVDKVIIQEKNIADRESRQRKTSKIVHISQGNYVGVYGPLWQGNKEELRKKYNIKNGEIVLFALGSIRPYKELPILIDAVEEACKEGVNCKLLIMGKLSKEYEPIITKKAEGKSAIRLLSGFVENEKIPEVFALADYSVFYYGDSSLSSAAMMLSLSYGVPVITRNIPASEIIKEGINGYVFSSKNELKRILRNIKKEIFDKNAIIGTVQGQDWVTVTDNLKHAYIHMFK